MANFELVMPKLGESIEEATITKWLVKAGDKVKDDDILLELATDKVDSEIPSPVAGTIIKILYQQDETVPVGTVIAIIDTTGADFKPDQEESKPVEISITSGADSEGTSEVTSAPVKGSELEFIETSEPDNGTVQSEISNRYYSPLVRKIASEEKISQRELETIPGTGRDGRVKKEDILKYIQKKDMAGAEAKEPVTKDYKESQVSVTKSSPEKQKIPIYPGDEVIKMDRMRKLIADHMIMSKSVSAHVTNMIETDVTRIVLWRNRIKEEFNSREKEKLTYLPIFLESVISSLKDYPMINASVDGDSIILRKNINLGIAVALPTGNLIVPVIKNADQLSLLGLIKALNQLANNARNNKLNPDDITGGTFTVSNFGTFRNIMGTPIINQPQVAVLGIGTVEKKPAVIETPEGDMIAIRHKMYLSLTYDHRIIDGALGGAYLRKLADYLEAFNSNRTL
jgi:2-oxoglutarate dehydrogenase E2 component (dihydrolipoamide succinyltransferase)